VNDERYWLSFERSGRAALLAFLLFLAFPLADLLHAHLGAIHVGLVVSGAAVFVAVYLWLMRTTAPLVAGREILALAVLVVLALALTLDNSANWVTLFIYVAAVCGFRLPARAAIGAIAGCVALTAATAAVSDYSPAATISFAIYAGAIGLMLVSVARLALANRELSAAREQIARLAVSDERLRFARDLHDLLGHSLSLIAIKSELAGRLLAHDPERAAAEVADIEQVTRQALQQVRETVTGYRAMTLAGELSGARMALSAAGIEATIEQPSVTLAPEAESILAWAVREGTTNVIRHSGATRCEITISAGASSTDVEVVDDGRGGDGDGGSGLAGLAERAWQRHGHVDAGPGPDGGYRLHVSVPTT
jgi:two-component system, NarL family, sensor histidine kinase DesK